MATNFPNSIDNGTSLPYPSATDDTNSPSLSGGQDNQNDAIIAVENKLGIADANAQAPASGYLLAGTGSGISSWSITYPTSTIVGISDTQTLTNKTIDFASNTITNISGSDIASQSITATQIANATITATQIASGTITYANLLSTIFSGQITIYTNPGSGGGTFKYVNIGGYKRFYGYVSGTSQANATEINLGVTFPTGFFSSLDCAVATVVGPSNTSYFVCNVADNSTSGITINLTNQTGTTLTTTGIFLDCTGV